MAAVDTSTLQKIRLVEEVVGSIRTFKNRTIANALIAFGTGGAATGNEVVGLWSQCLQFYNSAADAIGGLTDSELQTYWEMATGNNVPAIRSDLTAIGTAITDLLDLIETSESVFLSGTLDRQQGRVIYPTLTAGQRAAVKAELDSIDALIE